MADYTVLAEAGQSLANVLWEEIKTDPDVRELINNDRTRISLESPSDLSGEGSAHLSIYLYRIIEDANTKNQFPVQGNGSQLRKPPLSLDLFYLITPMVGSPREQQMILGKVLQIFYDRPILEGPDLDGSLALSGEKLRVIFNPVSLEETARVWQSMEMSYRLSVCYVVRVAMMDSRREQFVQPVVQKTSQYGS